MFKLDLIVKNGRIVNSQRVYRVDLGIKDGKFCLIGEAGAFPRAAKVIDAEGNFILPGLVDSHVHVREPGFTEKEDFCSATMAAAAGGVTTVICMPTTSPTTTTEKALLDKITLGESKAVVDFALEAGVNPNRLDELPRMAKIGPASYEIFLMDAPPDMAVKDDATLWQILKAIANVEGVVGVYCGDESLKVLFTEEIRQSGRKDPMAHVDSRPPVLEALGVSRVLALALELGVRIHFRQVTTKEAVNLIRTARKTHPAQEITAEVNPHHLLLTKEEMVRHGPYVKMFPPLRTKDDIVALWQAITGRGTYVISSDHAPHTKEEKALGLVDIWAAPAGIPGVQTLLPLMLNEVNKGHLDLTRLVGLCSENPARIFRLYPRKGTISVGSDADMVIVNMDQEKVIRSEDQYSKARFTPFDGWKVKGVPSLTMVRGKIVMERGQVTSEPWGRFVPANLRRSKEH